MEEVPTLKLVSKEKALGAIKLIAPRQFALGPNNNLDRVFLGRAWFVLEAGFARIQPSAFLLEPKRSQLQMRPFLCLSTPFAEHEPF